MDGRMDGKSDNRDRQQCLISVFVLCVVENANTRTLFHIHVITMDGWMDGWMDGRTDGWKV